MPNRRNRIARNRADIAYFLEKWHHIASLFLTPHESEKRMFIHEVIDAMAAIKKVNIASSEWEPVIDEATWHRAGTLENEELCRLFIVRLQWWKDAQKRSAQVESATDEAGAKRALLLFLNAHLKWNLIDSLFWHELRLALPHLSPYRELCILPGWEIAFKK
jgi:hypothetical protein